MKTKCLGLSFLVSLLVWVSSSQVIAKEPPVAKIVKFEGTVEYSRNGTKWNPVRRTKYLFSGYQLRTGEDGSGTIINLPFEGATGSSQELGPSSQVEFDGVEVTVIVGTLSEPEDGDASVMQSLTNKFAKAQRYTTVRRSVVKPGADESCDNKVRTIKSVTVSSRNTDLVWRNACPEFSYKLVIDDEMLIDIPAKSTSEMIRYDVSSSSVGTHTYRVEVLDKDGTVYIPRKESEFQVMSTAEEEELNSALDQAGDDIFLETDLLEARGLYVAAMDAFRGYFEQNPEDNDMRPLLIQSYQGLKLSNLRESEARLYNAALEEDY
jgi:hypothetical protein